MKTPHFAFLVALFLVCCSKTAQEDTTAATTIPLTKAEENKLVTLTPEEMEQVHLALFLRLHEFQMFGNEDGWTAMTEEYKPDNNRFTYSLVRSNKSPGYYTDLYNVEGGPVRQDPAESAYAQEYDDSGEAYGEASDDSYGEAYGESSYEVPGYYINEYDTLSGSGMFIAMLESAPEQAVKTVRCRISGTTTWENYYSENEGERARGSRYYQFDDLLVDLGAPIQLTREQLYLKAKIMALTESDLAGMDKDELGYLRNEIFARHGHTFKTEKMSKRFNEQTWYYAMVGDATNLLNEVEKKNVEFIKKKEG